MGFFFLHSLIIFIGLHESFSLLVRDISVPALIDYRERAKLSCNYNMGEHTLNSIKWYKDDMEFFRYAPMNIPTIVNFTVNGVHLVDERFNCNHASCTVTLEKLESKTSGAYRCEISGDAPEFKLVSKTANLTVEALPRTDPVISDVAQSYVFGDYVSASCTSDKSSIPATLTWYINDKAVLADKYNQQKETKIKTNEFLLYSYSLEVRFYIDKEKYNHQLILKCVANIDQYPTLVRKRSHKIYIDDVTNEKLINWKNVAVSNNFQFSFANLITNIFTIVLLNLVSFSK